MLLVSNELEKMWMEVVVAYNGLVGLNTTGLRRTDISGLDLNQRLIE